jgi:hypothetical protein
VRIGPPEFLLSRTESPPRPGPAASTQLPLFALHEASSTGQRLSAENRAENRDH